MFFIVLDPEERRRHLESLMKNADENVNNYKTTLVNSIGDSKVNLFSTIENIRFVYPVFNLVINNW